MANGKYLYEVAVDTGSALRAAQNVRTAFQREMASISTSFNGDGGIVNRLAGSVSNGLGQGMFAGLRGGLAGGVAGVVASITATELANMARFATQLKNSEQALASFSGNATMAEQRIQAVQDAAGGAITRFDALRIANMGAALGFANTSEELARVTELSAKAAAVLGGTTAANVENLALAASNLSFERLDMLGISADQVRVRFAELSKEMDKSSAFMLAALEVGERTYRNVEAQASGVERLAAAWADLRATGAGVGAPLVENVANFGADGLRGIELAIDYYRRMNEAQAIFERGMTSADPVVKAHADQIGYLGQQLATGEIGFQEYMAAINQAILTLGQYEAQANSSADATNRFSSDLGGLARQISIGGKMVNINTQDGVGQSALDAYRDYHQQQAQDRALEIAWLGEQADNKMRRENLARNQELAREQSRLAKQTASDTTNAWQRAAQNVQSAWEKAVGGVAGIPGVTGRSQVTELDMRLSEFGLYQSKPDEFLRQVEDQLINNVNRGIDRGVIASLTSQSTGFDLGKVDALPNDLLAQLFGKEYESGRLFSTPLGQGMAGRLFDTSAVGAGIEAANAAGAGSDFIKKLLGEDLPAQFAGVAGEALKGLREGILTDDLSSIGSQAMDSLLSAFTNRTSTSPQVEAAANSIIAEFFRRYQEALNGGT